MGLVRWKKDGIVKFYWYSSVTSVVLELLEPHHMNRRGLWIGPRDLSGWLQIS